MFRCYVSVIETTTATPVTTTKEIEGSGEGSGESNGESSGDFSDEITTHTPKQGTNTVPSIKQTSFKPVDDETTTVKSQPTATTEQSEVKITETRKQSPVTRTARTTPAVKITETPKQPEVTTSARQTPVVKVTEAPTSQAQVPTTVASFVPSNPGISYFIFYLYHNVPLSDFLL